MSEVSKRVIHTFGQFEERNKWIMDFLHRHGHTRQEGGIRSCQDWYHKHQKTNLTVLNRSIKILNKKLQFDEGTSTICGSSGLGPWPVSICCWYKWFTLLPYVQSLVFADDVKLYADSSKVAYRNRDWVAAAEWAGIRAIECNVARCNF